MSDQASPLTEFSDAFDAFFKQVAATLSTWKGNFVNNSEEAFTRMTTKNWLRLTVIVCSYLLLRPYLLQLAGKVQESYMEKEAAKMGMGPGTKINANDLRGGKMIEIPGVDSDSEEDKEEWGRKARVRQRKVVKKAMAIHEKNLRVQEMDSDEDISDLLQ